MDYFLNQISHAKHIYLFVQVIVLEYLPARYVLTFLTFWGMSLEFAQRVCLSVTIVAMVNHSAIDIPNNDSENNLNDSLDMELTCSGRGEDNETLPYEMGEYVWTPSIQGVVLGAYFYGYVCTQAIGGRIADTFGGKWTLGLAILSASFFTVVTPVSADINFILLIAVRILLGLVHGVCLPSAYAMFTHWAPESERSTLVALCSVGDNLGTVVTMPLAGYLCEHGFSGGWPSVYYILGTLGIVWFVFWISLVHSMPHQHPRISQKELLYIQSGQVIPNKNQKLPFPWKKVMASIPVWSVAAASFSMAWGFFTLLTKLPTYLEVMLHVPIQKNGFFNSMIYVCTCVALFFSAYIADHLRAKNYSITKIRKFFQTLDQLCATKKNMVLWILALAMLGPALSLGLIPSVGCNSKAVIGLLTVAMTFHGMAGGGHVGMAIDLAPCYAGTIFGLVNGLGCTSGILSPLTAGLLLDSGHNDTLHWSYVFYLSSAIYIVGFIVFMWWASADLQPWAIAPTEKSFLMPKSPAISIKLEHSINYGSVTQEFLVKNI